MKTPRFLTALALLLVATLLPTPRAQAAEPQVLTAAILDFQSGIEKSRDLGGQISSLLAVKLSTSDNLLLVERQELEKIQGEMELGLSGTVTPESAAKIGHLTGAKILITGRVFGADQKSNYIVAKIISTETSRVYGEAVTYSPDGKLDEPVAQLAEKIAAAIKQRADTLVAKVESPEALIERLRKSVEGKALPTVAIEIAESHVSHAIRDPAAETEIKFILQKVGFDVLDPARAERKPDVAIKGEAFSEMAMRRGNLVSCKARVEIKVVPRDEAKPTQVERQTEVAVDLSENVAAKSALQKAGSRLAERLVPMLAPK
ncbi:MAG: hypothetical protein QOE70_6227 [Chthoniobacter sp.]|jgi:hypothetical protein|nr:hypothetical protein [Chthoniobacter sp.]